MSVSGFIALVGATFYAALAFEWIFLPPYRFFGQDIYDQYYLAILDGRLDLPVRVLRFEGHYRPDGTAYVYHGVAPLLTRFVLGWAFDLNKVSLAPFSNWLWAVVGTTCYHIVFLRLARIVQPQGGSFDVLWSLLLAVAIWFCAPGILLVANPSLFHEPISITYAATGASVLLWTMIVFNKMPVRWALIGLAILAAITVHARPNVAVGLYCGVVLTIAFYTYRFGLKSVIPSAVALTIMLASGLGFLALNKQKFGSVTDVHGSYRASEIQYGPVYWGIEKPNSPRADAFAKHGQINIARILPNLALYLFDLPEKYFKTPSQMLLDQYRKVTEPSLGFIRVVAPRIGMVFLWAPWFVLVLATPFARNVPKVALAPIIGTGVAAIVTLAYGTINLRYRIDIWPLLATLAFFGAYSLRLGLPPRRFGVILAVAFPMAVGLATIVSLGAALEYRDKNLESVQGFYRPWSVEYCLTLSQSRRFTAARAREICNSPVRQQ